MALLKYLLTFAATLLVSSPAGTNARALPRRLQERATCTGRGTGWIDVLGPNCEVLGVISTQINSADGAILLAPIGSAPSEMVLCDTGIYDIGHGELYDLLMLVRTSAFFTYLENLRTTLLTRVRISRTSQRVCTPMGTKCSTSVVGSRTRTQIRTWFSGTLLKVS